jgi:hypothetical protein
MATGWDTYNTRGDRDGEAPSDLERGAAVAEAHQRGTLQQRRFKIPRHRCSPVGGGGRMAAGLEVVTECVL